MLSAEPAVFIWDADWKRKQKFTDLPNLIKVLGFEDQSSRILPAIATDMAARDFRLPQELFDTVERAYPRGSVPDCLLGVR